MYVCLFVCMSVMTDRCTAEQGGHRRPDLDDLTRPAGQPGQVCVMYNSLYNMLQQTGPNSTHLETLHSVHGWASRETTFTVTTTRNVPLDYFAH